MNRSFAIILAALSISTALAGCSVNLADGGHNGHDSGMMGNHSANDSAFSGADIMFAQMMIPHHQQAIEMSTLAETQTKNPLVLALAKQIKNAQTPEIVQMKSWLAAANAPLEMNHSMGMDGMLSTTDLQKLAAATDANFDKLYLSGMIGHHQGAVQMAQMVLDSKNAEARALGEDVVKSQTVEIDKMKALLASLG